MGRMLFEQAQEATDTRLPRDVLNCRITSLSMEVMCTLRIFLSVVPLNDPSMQIARSSSRM